MKKELTICQVKFFKQFVIVKFKGIDNINDVEQYKGSSLFVSRENAVSLEENEYYIDLLFFHRKLNSLVAIELKVGKFKPEYAGKMNFYLNILNDKVKMPHENPAIGIILCTDKTGIEVEYAKMDGVKFLYYTMPLEISDEGIKCVSTELRKDEDGIDTVYAIDGTEELIPTDSIIIAVGQGPRTNIVSSTKGIDVNNRGLLSTDEYGRTSFASGDVVTGAKTVVEAVRLSKKVAEVIDEYVTSTYKV